MRRFKRRKGYKSSRRIKRYGVSREASDYDMVCTSPITINVQLIGRTDTTSLQVPCGNVLRVVLKTTRMVNEVYA